LFFRAIFYQLRLFFSGELAGAVDKNLARFLNNYKNKRAFIEQYLFVYTIILL
jgi:hypothetical protein